MLHMECYINIYIYYLIMYLFICLFTYYIIYITSIYIYIWYMVWISWNMYGIWYILEMQFQWTKWMFQYNYSYKGCTSTHGVDKHGDTHESKLNCAPQVEPSRPFSDFGCACIRNMQISSNNYCTYLGKVSICFGKNWICKRWI